MIEDTSCYPLIVLTSLEVPFFMMEPSGGGDSWDFDTSWGDPHPVSSKQTQEASAVNRQELLQKRKEERRQKQQAAREKRSAGMSLKPSGLGAMKK